MMNSNSTVPHPLSPNKSQGTSLLLTSLPTGPLNLLSSHMQNNLNSPTFPLGSNLLGSIGSRSIESGPVLTFNLSSSTPSTLKPLAPVTFNPTNLNQVQPIQISPMSQNNLANSNKSNMSGSSAPIVLLPQTLQQVKSVQPIGFGTTLLQTGITPTIQPSQLQQLIRPQGPVNLLSSTSSTFMFLNGVFP